MHPLQQKKMIETAVYKMKLTKKQCLAFRAMCDFVIRYIGSGNKSLSDRYHDLAGWFLHKSETVSGSKKASFEFGYNDLADLKGGWDIWIRSNGAKKISLLKEAVSHAEKVEDCFSDTLKVVRDEMKKELAAEDDKIKQQQEKRKKHRKEIEAKKAEIAKRKQDAAKS